MSAGNNFFYATLIADNEQQAKDMAVAETKRGVSRDWSARVLESDVEGPARALSSGSRDA
jgi:hypothetical protein